MMPRSRHVVARLAAAVLATAAVGLGGLATAPPAAASACASGSGVTVVVDFGSLGGGVQSACVADGGGQRASSLFSSAGFDLSYVQNEPGFVCRIDQRPAPDVEACVNTPPDNAYWGLWWSDGTSGSWSYSNYGAGSLKAPDGAYVGFAWQTGGSNAPGLSPAPHAAAPPSSATPTTKPSSGPSSKPSGKPTAKPSSKPSSKPSGRPSSPPTSQSGTSPTGSASAATAAPSTTPDETGSASATTTESPTDSASASPSGPTTQSTEVAATVDGSESSGPGVGTGEAAEVDEPAALPAWVVPLVLVLLAGGGAAAYLLRRRSRPGP